MDTKELDKIYEWPLPTRLLIYVGVTLLTVYLGYFFSLSGVLEKMSDCQKQEDELKQQLSDVIVRTKKVDADLTGVPVLKAALLDWQKKIIKYEELPELLNEILKVGAEQHLYFNAFNPSLGKKNGYYSKITIKVIATGSYNQIANFLSQVANLGTIVSIRNFSISSAQDAVTKNRKPDQPITVGSLIMDAELEVNYVPQGIAHAKT